MSQLPSQARIREVGPRDGQNERDVIPTGTKIQLVEMLAHAGLRRLEVTSFVRPDVIPQLADASEVLTRIRIPDDVAISVLVPNERGLARALEHRSHFHEINVFLGASESHNRHNGTAPCASRSRKPNVSCAPPARPGCAARR